MTLYYYSDAAQLPQASVNHGLALAVTASETAALPAPRKGGNPLTLTVASTQNTRYPSFTQTTGGIDPFSGVFSTDFGGGTGVGGTVIGKAFNLTDAGTVAAATTKAHAAPQALSAASAQGAFLTIPKFAGKVFSIAAAEVIRLVLARPLHEILAARNAEAYGMTKAQGRNFAVGGVIDPFTQEYQYPFGGGPGGTTGGGTEAFQGQRSASALTVQHGRGYAASDAAAQALKQTLGVVRRIAVVEAVALLKRVGKPFAVASPSVQRRGGGASNRILSSGIAQVAAIVRALPLRLSAASIEATSSPVPGGARIFVRIFSAASAEALGMARFLGLSRGAVYAEAVALRRGPARATATSDAQTVAVVRQTTRLFGLLGSASVSVLRRTTLVRGIVAASIAALVPAASRLRALTGAVTTQVAAVGRMFAHGVLLFATDAYTAAIVHNPTKTYPTPLSVASSQTARVARSIARTVMHITSSSVQSLLKAAGLVRSAVDGTLAAVLFPGTLHVLIQHATDSSKAALRASYSRAFSIATAAAVKLITHRGSFLGVASAEVIAFTKASIRIFPLLTGQSVALTKVVFKRFPVMSGEALSSTRAFFRLLSAVSAEVASSFQRRGSTFTGTINAQIGALARSTAKLIGLSTPEVAGGGRGTEHAFGATSPNTAATDTPRGQILRARQGQSGFLVRWYHIYVPLWADQQTVLLPPSGGPAEPPDFGPIDPADQTIFGFDWSSRAIPGDTIVSATVFSEPAGLVLYGPVYIQGTLVQATVMPFTAPVLPTVYLLRCTVVFASARISTFSIPVPVRTL